MHVVVRHLAHRSARAMIARSTAMMIAAALVLWCGCLVILWSRAFDASGVSAPSALGGLFLGVWVSAGWPGRVARVSHRPGT